MFARRIRNDTMQILRPSDWHAQPWKNGRGVTHEVYRLATATSDDYDLRVSVAEIEGAQPFSLFRGYQRTLGALDESDLQLVVNGATMPLVRHQPLHFSGDVAVESQGVGRTRDLNVIARTEIGAHVEVSTTETPRHSPTAWPVMKARRLLVFALEATVLRCDDGSAAALEPFDTAVFPAGSAPTLEKSALVVWVRF